ncbi:sulfatase-like hydrolase/transferase [Coraliomargarita sp. W4R72]
MEKQVPKFSSGYSRRDFMFKSSLAAAGGMLAKPLLGVQAPNILRSKSGKRPNIIYFVAHDLGKHISTYGVPVPTPTLDGLAASGVTLDRAFCTSPPCSPSRGCALTGHPPHRNGLMGLVNHGWALDAQPPNIVDVLNSNGYETASAGFTHERHGGARNMKYQKVFGNRMEDTFIENAIDDSIGYLKSRKSGDKPFYLNIGTMETHGSQWNPKSQFAKQAGRGVAKFGVDTKEATYIPPEMPETEYSYEMMRHFAPCIRYMDAQLARLIEYIETMDEADNTLFVFTTDHGILSSRGKGTIYEHGMEIATIFHQPGRLDGGMRFPHLVANADFFPTLLDYVGIQAPPNFATSHWNGLSGEGAYTPQEQIFIERNYHENYDPIRSVRTPRYQYIRNFHPFAKKFPTPAEILASNDPRIHDLWPSESTLAGPDHSSQSLAKYQDRDREELYDLENDPGQLRNLAGEPVLADVKDNLSSLCDDYMQRTNDPLLRGPIPPTQAQYELIKKRTGKTVGPPIEETLGVVS